MTTAVRRTALSDSGWRAAAATVVLIAVMATAPAHAQFTFPSPQQPAQPAPAHPQTGATDPRLNLAKQARADLEGRGFKVYDVGFIAGRGDKLPVWHADVAADYSQPNGGRILTMAFSVWAILHRIAGQEPPETVLLNGQVWTKYVLFLASPLGAYDQLLMSLRAAGSEADKKRAVDTFLATVNFKVYDMERRQLVDQKDFVNKNFSQ